MVVTSTYTRYVRRGNIRSQKRAIFAQTLMSVGYNWTQMTTLGYKWIQLATFGQIWPQNWIQTPLCHKHLSEEAK